MWEIMIIVIIISTPNTRYNIMRKIFWLLVDASVRKPSNCKNLRNSRNQSTAFTLQRNEK